MPEVGFGTGAARGLLTGWVDRPGGAVRVCGYDAWGREVNSVLSTQGAVLRAQTAYDRAGAPLSVSEQLEWRGRTYTRGTANTYDAAGRLAKTEVSTGGSVRGWQTYGYDAAGRLASVTCGNNVRRTRSYDVHGWPVKTVTSVPRFQALDTAAVALPFYRAAVGAGIGFGSRYTEYTEQLFYAEGVAPRYGGVPSALLTTLGGRYDYSYDGFDRLVEAAYTAGEDAAEGEDFSAVYTYTPTSAPLSVQRSGVVDVAVGAGATETFGTLDHLTYTWDGARLQSVDSESHGSNYLGRPGYATSWYGDNSAYTWNAAGQMVSDASRGISRVSYAACGLPQHVMLTNGDYVSYVRATDGTLLGVSTYQKLGGRRAVRTARRVYVGDWELDADTVTLVRCPWGWIDAAGRASYEHRDTRGSVTMVTEHHGSVAVHTGYYPDGEPWRTPAGRTRQLEGKERLTALGLNEYLYPGRHYTASTTLFTTPDPLSADFGWLNPYTYCAANPNRFVDPTGELTHLYIDMGGLFGHVFISTGAGDRLKVYSYGRYRDLDKPKLGKCCPTGDGVLKYMEGENAQNFIKSNPGVVIFEFKKDIDNEVDSYFEKRIREGKEQPEKVDPNKVSIPAREIVIDHYEIVKTNCTTTSLDAVNNAGIDTSEYSTISPRDLFEKMMHKLRINRLLKLFIPQKVQKILHMESEDQFQLVPIEKVLKND